MCIHCFLTLGQLPYGVRTEVRGSPAGLANVCGGEKASIEAHSPESLRMGEGMSGGIWFGYFCNCLTLVCSSSPWGSPGSTRLAVPPYTDCCRISWGWLHPSLPPIRCSPYAHSCIHTCYSHVTRSCMQVVIT